MNEFTLITVCVHAHAIHYDFQEKMTSTEYFFMGPHAVVI